MYHKGLQIIFIHIPKTAGQSIHQSFGIDGFEFSFAEEHRTAQQHLEILGENVFDQCFKFSFVRNPWVRMASIYFYYYQYHKSLDFCPTAHLPSNSDPKKLWDLSFKKWLKAFCPDNKGVMGAAHKTCILYFNQLNWLVSSNTTDNELLVDYIGRVENIQSDMDHICNQIGIKKMDLSVIKNTNPVLQPKVGFSTSCKQVVPEYSSVYDEESIEIVRNLCKKDIDFFEYECPFIKKYS